MSNHTPLEPLAASPLPDAASPGASVAGVSSSARIASIDALRGFVMFVMIYVNDIAGVSDKIVPPWMKHFHGKNGMTFVDLVFPGFLFVVGMSLPFALGARVSKGEALWKTLLHVASRTLSLLFIGILMVNKRPDSLRMGWSGTLWALLMYLSAIAAFCTFSSPRKPGGETPFHLFSMAVRGFGLVSLVYLAFEFRAENGRGIICLYPFSIHTSYYGILGLIGWAYLVGAVVFLLFKTNRTGLLGCVALLMCLYAADKKGAFDDLWLSRYLGIGEMLGSQAAITVAGLLLATVLITADTRTIWSRTRFTLLFIAGCAAAALLLDGLYGISKGNATPSWCFWACATTAACWLLFYFACDVRRVSLIAKPFGIAGQNVLLAYLLSSMLSSLLSVCHLGPWYSRLGEPDLLHAAARSVGCATVILCFTAGLNRLGLHLKL